MKAKKKSKNYSYISGGARCGYSEVPSLVTTDEFSVGVTKITAFGLVSRELTAYHSMFNLFL